MKVAGRALSAAGLCLLLAACAVPSLAGGASSQTSQNDIGGGRLPQTTTPAVYQPTADPKPGGTITIGTWQFPSRISPYIGSQTAAIPVEQAVFNGLLGSTPSLDAFGDLAQDVPTLDNGGVRRVGDGMDVTYRLRRGLAWSDGQPITPDDVIFTFQLIRQSGFAGASQQGYEQITTIDRVGQDGLVLHFGSLFPAYRSLFPAILPKHRLESVAPTQLINDPYWTKPDIVSGPFAVQEVTDNQISLVRNPHYADGRSAMAFLGHAAYADRLVFRAFSSRQAVLAALKANDAQAALDLTERELNTVAGMTGVAISLSASLAYEQVSLNQANPNPGTGSAPPWIGDAPVREALDLALDRPGIERRLAGGPLRTATPIGPMVGWAYDSAVGPPAYDLQRAKRILEQDGWAVGTDGIRVKNGKRLAFALTTPAGQLRATERDVLIGSWRSLGADVTVQEFSTAALFASFDQGGVLARGLFEAAIWSWSVPPDPDSEFAIFHSSATPASGKAAGENYSRCHDSAVDQALVLGRSTLDPAQRAAAYRAFQVAYARARCELPLYRRVDIGAASPALRNFTLNASPAGNTWNVADWWIASH